MDELLTNPTEPELNALARRVVAANATDTNDARELLSALGLLHDNYTNTTTDTEQDHE